MAESRTEKQRTGDSVGGGNASQLLDDRRIPIVAPTRVTSIDGERDPRTGSRTFVASGEVCANLSAHGAFIRTDSLLTPGRRVLLEINLPSGSVETVGRVAWSRHTMEAGEPNRSGVGVEFVGTSDETRQALQRFIDGFEEDEGTNSN